MKCPHCKVGAVSKVLETRRTDTGLFRRRGCLACSKAFVTEEVASPELRMPPEVRADRKKAPRAKAAKPRPSTPGADLAKLW